MLNRLGIRQKLTVLLLIPLAAVVLVLVPYTAERITDARSAGATARIALAAREVGGLIEDLQQERLLTLGYLSVGTMDRSALVGKTQAVADEAARLRTEPDTAGVLIAAAPALAALDGVRDAALSHRTDAPTVYAAFRAADTALLTALRLSNAPGADAAGQSQLGALDELMRSNEEASSVGTLLVAAVADPSVSRGPLSEAVIADQQHLQRFRELVPADQSALVDTIEGGQAGQRIRQLVSAVTSPSARPPAPDASCAAPLACAAGPVCAAPLACAAGPLCAAPLACAAGPLCAAPLACAAGPLCAAPLACAAGPLCAAPLACAAGPVSDALTAAVSYTDLRRFAQDRLAREVATGAQNRAAAAGVTASLAVIGAVVLLVLVAGLGWAVSRSIARPLRRLTRAAVYVAELAATELTRVSDSDSHDAPAARLRAVQVDSADEIGELANALNRVQATAALLLERQVSARRNVSVMFANIARRTQNLVGRQLNLIDELERNERSPELVERLYRLDHVATRLRRSADSLLVVSGTIDQVMSGGPSRLADVIRAALTEIEAYESIDIADLPDVAVTSAVAADLRLLLAELLENSSNFSPPGSRVSVTASLTDELRIVVVDHGLGISQVRLDEENRRLLERERLDVAPTTVLGLFVVGRLARRHGLSVRLDHSPNRGITATVRIPMRLLADPKTVGRATSLTARVRPTPLPGRRGPAHAGRLGAAEAIIDAVEVAGDGFPWFVPPRELSAGVGTQLTAGPGIEATAGAGTGLAMRPAAGAWPPSATGSAPARPDPTRSDQTHRHEMREAPVTRDDGLPAIPAQTQAGLARRVPGTHLRIDDPPTSAHPIGVRAPRDPEAEREMLNDYVSGLAKSGDDGQSPRSTLAERHS